MKRAHIIGLGISSLLVLGLSLIVNSCKVTPSYECPGFLVVQIQKGDRDTRRISDTIRVPYVCNEIVLDPRDNDAPHFQDTLSKLGFIKADTCPCASGMELWRFEKGPDIDVIGIVESPPPSGDGVGGISLNYLLNFPAADKPVGRENPIVTKELPCKAGRTVKIAVVDTGVDTVTNPSDNALLLVGWNKAPLLPVCPPHPPSVTYGLNVEDIVQEPYDKNGHGTHVNGIIAGVPSMVAGQPIIQIPCQFINARFTEGSSRSGSLFNGLCALYYVLDQKVDVINVSWGFIEQESKPWHQLFVPFLDRAAQENVLIVAGIGNDSIDVSGPVKFWPACFAAKYKNVISVGAVGSNGQRSIFSNWAINSDEMTLAALGEDVPSAFPKPISPSGLVIQSGTSMATPFVTRTAAAMQAIQPAIMATGVRGMILANAQNLGGYFILKQDEAILAACNPI